MYRRCLSANGDSAGKNANNKRDGRDTSRMTAQCKLMAGSNRSTDTDNRNTDKGMRPESPGRSRLIHRRLSSVPLQKRIHLPPAQLEVIFSCLCHLPKGFDD